MLCACGCGGETKTSRSKKQNRFIHTHNNYGYNRSKHDLNISAFSSPLSREAKYWIGFLMADGCVCPSRGYDVIELQLKIDDIVHVERFADFVGIERRFVKTHTQNGSTFGVQTSARLRFTGKELAIQLREFGIVYRKSLIACINPILNNDPDFWRGMLDGDGCLSWRMKCPAVRLCGSQQVVESFSDYLLFITGVKPKLFPVGNIFITGISCSRARAAVDTIYYEGCDPVLDRKMKIAEEMKNWKGKRDLKLRTRGFINANILSTDK